MRLGLVTLLIVATFNVLSAQSLKSIPGDHVLRPVCEASGTVEKSFIPPPAEFLLKSGEPTAEIIVEFGSGFPEDARNALNYAVGIWASIIESDVPIHINARWSSTLGTNTLASCGPETYYTNFKNIPFENRYYAVAIAEKIAGEELNGVSRSDVEATFSSRINWYYGTDGNTPTDKYDFVSVALHEIAHGLGFTGFFYVDAEAGMGGYAYYEYGDATTFDMLVEKLSGSQLLNTTLFSNPSAELKSALTGSLYANSPVAKSENSGVRPRLYSPSTYNDGSSVYHLNDFTYGTGNENSLMTHAVGMGEAIHDPGPLARGIMEDIGWTNLIVRHTPVKDMEEVGTLHFVANIDSYYDVEEGSVLVVYSTDNFESTRDTLVLTPTANEGEYSATLEPQSNVDIQYYLEAADVKGRLRMSPWDAPQNVHDVHFGPDNEDPVIASEAIPYFLLRGEPLQIKAEVDDNLGLDTVYVTYSINDVDQTPFPLLPESGTTFTGTFNFDLLNLHDGDLVKYNIVARDASSNQNTTIYPAVKSMEFRIERIFDAVTNYETDFNSESSAFIISDFSIYTAENFNNDALHSPHPYPSPNIDNKDLNFSTFLKYPIILQEDGDMSFDEVVLVEPGEFMSVYGDDDFWDYVIVEGSKDYGESWYALTDGYDSGENATWQQNYNAGIPSGEQDSETKGTAEWFVNHQISLLESGHFNVGDTILIRFRLYSDPYANGWGWAIDNLRVQYPLATATVLSPGQVNAYPNPFNTAIQVEIYPDSELQEVRIEVFDVFGRKLQDIIRQNVEALKETIDLRQYSSGLFLLKVSENGKPVLSKKMIKN
ncbi:T9SS type A sorting domain-containing protein [Maribellus sediminis]|uniref:T9SS type A sorting domain-containing protein n=1 Tax=Maribellus sediminis TaxID=2696285 RepID=UPI0014316550|nr:T9SS type A sorting domain-containing protein [Maribellus sediminis]